jgi:hypothetical protein
MYTYKLIKDHLGNNVDSVRRSDGISIPVNPDNTDYIAYLKWVSEGNTPLPAEENQ